MIDTNCWRFFFTSACLLSISAASVQAQETVAGAAVSDSNYWTAERLLNAKPLDAPASAGSLSEALAAGEGLEILLDQPSVAEAGAAPGIELSDAEFGEPAYSPEDAEGAALSADEEIGPSDVGTGGGYYSSSRLIPTTARLTYPYRAAGKLFFTKPGEGDFVCSAAVLRPRIILTAGHCAHSGSNGSDGFFGNFEFIPAFHQGNAELFRWTGVWAVTTGSWATSGNTFPNRADFAILEMRDRIVSGNTRRIGEITGYYGYQTSALIPNHVKMIGYPVGFDNGWVMHQVDAGHYAAGGAETVLYGSDMRGGSSGGPWVENFGVASNGQTGGLAFRPNRIVGVTSYLFIDPAIKLLGSSVLNDEFLQILDIACNRRAGNC